MSFIIYKAACCGVNVCFYLYDLKGVQGEFGQTCKKMIPSLLTTFKIIPLSKLAVDVDSVVD